MIGNAVRGILTNDAGVAALVSTRIYPNYAPETPTQPYVVYNLVDSESVMSLTGHSGLGRHTYQIDVFDDDYGDAHQVAEEIRLALQDFQGTQNSVDFQDVIAGPMSDDLSRFQDGSETPICRVTRDYTFWFAEAAS